MIPLNPWPEVLLRFALYTATLSVVGMAIGRPFLVLYLGTLAYLVLYLLEVARLERWLRVGRQFKPPQGYGLWDSVFNGLLRLQSRHRQRNRRLADMLNAFRESIDAVPDAAVVLRGGGEIVWWNPAAERLLGLKQATDAGRRLDNLYRNPEFSRFIRRRSSETRQIILPSPIDEELMLDIRLVAYGRNQRLLLARDITRVHRLENMRRDFVANVSHELRTPLTVVHGAAETLGHPESSLAAEDRHMVDLIQQQAQRMGRLVEDLLLLSRLETSSRPTGLEPVDVPAMLNAVRDDAVALSAERNHEIRLEVVDDCHLCADEGELHSAFSNLVVNAVNYTPDGGRIVIRWWRDRNGVCFSVTDTGVGIAPEHIPRLTERFYRVDKGRSTRTGGTGLGLAIVKHILQRYDASLEIESTPGQGSTFRCRFPAGLCQIPA